MKLAANIVLPSSYHYKVNMVVCKYLVLGLITCCRLLQDYVALVESLPDTDKPSFFGLPANIERSAQQTTSSRACVCVGCSPIRIH